MIPAVSKAGVNKFLGRLKFCTVEPNICGAYNFQVTARLLEDLCTQGLLSVSDGTGFLQQGSGRDTPWYHLVKGNATR